MIYHHTLARAARFQPHSLAVVDGELRLTFQELEHRAAGLAAHLAQAGFLPGDRLALLAPNCAEYLIVLYACLRMGLTLVPMNTRYAVPEMDEVMEDCDPKGLVMHHALPRPVRSAPWEIVIGRDEIPCAEGPAPGPVHDPHALLGLFYTSGTTGRAKGVMLTHTNSLANMLTSSVPFGVRRGDVFLHVAPMFHVADFPLTLAGCSEQIPQVTLPRFDLKLFCETVEKEGVTMTVMIPTMVNFLTQFDGLGNYTHISVLSRACESPGCSSASISIGV